MPNAQSGNSLNMTGANPSKPHSNFLLPYEFGCTPQFGKNTPFFAFEAVTDDNRIHIQPNCSTRSYTLKAPMYGNIKKHIAFYQVPLQCLLPINWEKIVKNASHGTDVQGDTAGINLVPALNGVNCVVSNFIGRIRNPFISDFNSLIDGLAELVADANYREFISRILHFVLRWEIFLSHGNLLSHLGVHYGEVFRFRFKVASASDTAEIDTNFDGFCEWLLDLVSRFAFTVVDDDGTDSVSGKGIPFVRTALDFMRSHSLPASISSVVRIEGSEDIPVTFSDWLVSTYVLEDVDTEPLNFGRCLAYQIVNAHYYTNDRIDYIYTADLYRQYIGDLVQAILSRISGGSIPFFSYNGISTQYDWLSGYFLDRILTAINNTSFDVPAFWQFYYPYLNAIFGFNYSLRYLDYFAGARPRNLAISGPNTPTNVQVQNNSVDVVNITKSLVAQRFLNAVARVPSNIEDYSEKILGRKPAYDWHNPRYLFSYDMDLFTQEVENTGAGQLSDPNSVTAVLRGSANNLEFTVDIDRYSWIIGVENFDFKRFYFTTQHRNTMAIDRFDMFVPELQYIGDQELKRSELVSGAVKDMPFGYTLRDMQFKQTFPECAGGFVDYLPGWLFKFDISRFNLRQLNEFFISPDFIRCKPEELDGFYLSLTGMTLASYFHFIELWNIKVSADRPMIAAPQIL